MKPPRIVVTDPSTIVANHMGHLTSLIRRSLNAPHERDAQHKALAEIEYIRQKMLQDLEAAKQNEKSISKWYLFLRGTPTPKPEENVNNQTLKGETHD